jgi:hypothetical protein
LTAQALVLSISKVSIMKKKSVRTTTFSHSLEPPPIFVALTIDTRRKIVATLLLLPPWRIPQPWSCGIFSWSLCLQY